MNDPKGKSPTIPGYDYGKPSVARSPVSLEELREIETSAGWSDEDARVLERHDYIFKTRAEGVPSSARNPILPNGSSGRTVNPTMPIKPG
jgi:hypothetical protein